MTAGRVFRISPPTVESKTTHQTSPRFISDVANQVFGPLLRLGFACLVCGHLSILGLKVGIDHMRTRQVLQERPIRLLPT